MPTQLKPYSKPNPNKPWSKLPEETKGQFDLFWAYAQIRTKKRRYLDIEKEAKDYLDWDINKNSFLIRLTRLAKRAHWQERIEAFDAFMLEQEENALAKIAVAHKQKRAELADLLLDKVKQQLEAKLDDESISMIDLSRAAKIAVEISRSEFVEEKNGTFRLQGLDFRLIINEQLSPIQSEPSKEDIED